MNKPLNADEPKVYRIIESAVPLISLLAVIIPIVLMRPQLLAPERYYNSLNLLLNMAIPIMLATMGQMLAMSIGEIDFSMETLVSLVTCVMGAVMTKSIALGCAMLAAIVVAYMIMGAFIHLKKLPSIIVTIGVSFVWTGIAVTLQPTPGGDITRAVVDAMRWRTPVLPLAIFAAVLLALAGHFLVFKTNFGILARGVGDNVRSIQQAGHSVLKIRVLVFGMAGFCGVLSGVALAGLTTSADSALAKNYTMLSIASVILGGGAFSGGKVSAFGAILGAVTMHLVNTLLMFRKVSPGWQAGVQGLIILLALYVGTVFKNRGKVRYI